MKYFFLFLLIFSNNSFAKITDTYNFTDLKGFVENQDIANLNGFLEKNDLNKNQLKELIEINIDKLLNFDANKKLGVTKLIDTDFPTSFKVIKEYQKNNFHIFKSLSLGLSEDKEYLYSVLKTLLENTAKIIDLSFYELLIKDYKLDVNYEYKAKQVPVIVITSENGFCENFFSSSYSNKNDTNVEDKLKTLNMFINSFNSSNIYNALIFFRNNNANLALKDINEMNAIDYASRKITICRQIGFSPKIVDDSSNIIDKDVYGMLLSILDPHNYEVLPFKRQMFKN